MKLKEKQRVKPGKAVAPGRGMAYNEKSVHIPFVDGVGSQERGTGR